MKGFTSHVERNVNLSMTRENVTTVLSIGGGQRSHRSGSSVTAHKDDEPDSDYKLLLKTLGSWKKFTKLSRAVKAEKQRQADKEALAASHKILTL